MLFSKYTSSFMNVSFHSQSFHYMKRLFLFIAFCSIVSAQQLWAQPIRKSNYDKIVELAYEKLAEKDYYNAITKFEEAYEEREDKTFLPILADLNYLVRDFVKAERYYARIFRADKTNEFAAKRYFYARSLKYNGKYEEAIPEFQKVLETATKDSLRTLIRNEISGAEMAMELGIANSDGTIGKGVKLENAGREVNTPNSEYSPAYGPGGDLYFVGFNNKEIVVVDEKNLLRFAQVFKSGKGDRGWKKPEPLGEKINRPDAQIINVAFSPKDNRVYITQGVLEGNVISDAKIYVAAGTDGAANEVKGINGNYIAKHPAVGELFGREVLYFSSNMPGGFGGFDLYYATRTGDGEYGAPVNLGDKINTPGNEETPFFRDGTLYFSSDGNPTFGGYDLFFTVWDGTSWSAPANMGAGYNTSVDDQSLSLDAEGYKGFLTSNRAGGRSLRSKTCCDDIYAFEIARISANLVVGVFDDAKKPLNGTSIGLIEMQNEKPGKIDSRTNANGNRYEFPLALDMPYKIVVSKEGYHPDSTTITTANLKENKTFEHRFYLKAKPVPPPVPEYDTITQEKPIVLENILYDLDKDIIKPEAEQDLRVVMELMNEYPDMVIELGSHTDYRSSDAYNKDLSQRRAESARRWLVRNGIARERINTVGYGESVPQTVSAKAAAQSNFLKEGDVLTPEYIDKLASEEQKEAAHALNRRTEFKIVKGPTSIIIKSTRLRKVEPTTKTAPNKQSQPAAAPKPAQSSAPVMEFKEKFVDFGSVKKGEKREYAYEFTNKGATDIIISLVSACDCTTVQYPEKPVKPGEKGIIHVVFDSTEKEKSEVIDVDIFLDYTDPVTEMPAIVRLQYKFDLVK